MNGIDFNLFGKDEKGELNKAGLDIIFLERMDVKDELDMNVFG